MESLKVAIASDWFYPKVGGVETHIHELALNLVRAGHEPHVITHDYRGYPWSGVDQFPYPVHRFRGLVYVRGCHVSLGPGMLLKINRMYKEIGFDVTHVHSLFSPLAVAVANLSRGIRGVPVVATSHSLYGWSLGRELLATLLLRRVLRRVDSFIAVSTAVYKDLQRLLGGSLGDRPIYLVPNGVDTRFWRKPEPEEREEARRYLGLGDEPVVIAVGRMTRRKMMHVVPRVAARAARLASVKPSLVIIGDGEMKSLVEEEAARHRNVFSKIILEGFVDRVRLRRYYWASDVMLMPSPLEALGLAAVEAAATGLPVVGLRGSGLRDLVVDGETGFLASSYCEAAERLAALLASEELRATMGEKAAARVQSLFSWDNVLPEIIKIYRATIEQAGFQDKRYLLYRLWRRISG